MQSASSNASVYTDFQGLGKLKANAARQTEASRREAAEQFEALFIQTMLKSMRAATPSDKLTGSDQVAMYQDMMDKQLSIDMAKKGGIGIANVIEQQLSGPDDSKVDTPETRPLERSLAFAAQLWRSGPQQPAAKEPSSAKATVTRPETTWQTPESFVKSLFPAARQAAARLGTQPEAVIAIAALETGWGKHVISGRNGLSSHNLFGIKSTDASSSDRVNVTTLEFEQGVMQKVRQPFRTYSSTTAAVADFVRFINENPRYKEAMGKADDPEIFLQEIHKAGYATDPDYAEKVVAVMRQIQSMTQGPIDVADNSTQENRI